MDFLALTTPEEHTLRINPRWLAAWGPKTIATPAGQHRGAFVVLAVGDSAPREVLENAQVIDRLWRDAMGEQSRFYGRLDPASPSPDGDAAG